MNRTPKTGKPPRGRPAIANPRHRPVSIVVSEVEIDQLRQIAKERGTSVSALVRDAAFSKLKIRR